MKKKKVIIGLFFLVIVIVLVGIFFFFNKRENFSVSKDSLVQFSGGAGEVIHNAYVYETTSNTKKYKYVLTTAVTKSWGSSEWNETTNKEGYAKSMEEVVNIAKEHHCSYAIYFDRTYTLDAFMEEFSKNN